MSCISAYKKLAHKLTSPDDFDRSLMLGFACMRMAGDRLLTVDGHKGVIHYDRSEIVFRAKNTEVQVCGQELCIAAYNKTYLSIKGQIAAINMRRYGG
ncbi:MAG: YabP/YqfC family sporulation protein [Clostridia bacterium]|nr:YabP/YqfC family sporulation protein [Clostridia bacterium]MBR4955730.1 YabP/YqfC family sporulation protein [Clostridia bacterium]MBR5903516.1 YabP/YqfC family sporulation protein [Clostridia bacterium]